MRFAIALLAASLAGPLGAQQTRSCDSFETDAEYIDPSQPRQSYANGAITLIGLDTEEPTCCSHHLMVLHPAAGGGEACTLISREGSNGWVNMRLQDATAAYDPALGLTVSVPARLYLPDSGFSNGTLLQVTINQSAGTVAVDQQLGGE